MYRLYFFIIASIAFSQESELGRIAVSRIEGPNKFYSRNFSNKLEQELFNVGFTVVERRDVKKIMDEWKLDYMSRNRSYMRKIERRAYCGFRTSS